MLDDDFPESVKQMKPRRVRISRGVERLLGSAPAEAPVDGPRGGPATRPQAGSQNAVACAACEQPHCRCGHYLHGQIEDEYLAWYGELSENCDLIAQDTDRRLKSLRWVGLAAAPFFLVPMITALFVPGMSPGMFLWMIPGVVIIGGATLAEKWILRHKVESMAFLEAADMETFLQVRSV